MSTPQSTDSTEGLRLLSLDGGGIRGLSSLIILKNIMYRIQRKHNLQELPLPWQYFSLMGGTSTGGLIVLMLGRLRMSVDDAITAYAKLTKTVFCNSKPMTSEGKFSEQKMEEAIKTVIADCKWDTNAKLLDPDRDGCKTFVCARNSLNMNAGIATLFRTYACDVPGSDCTIWEAARATSASVDFFGKGMKIGTQTYVDGGMGRNNPTPLVIDEAKRIFPNRPLSFVLSIGTGQNDTIALAKRSLFIRKTVSVSTYNEALKDIAMDCEKTHQDVLRQLENTGNSKAYFRFNVAQGMHNVSLLNWEELPAVEAHTNSYLGYEEVKKEMNRAVDIFGVMIEQTSIL